VAQAIVVTGIKEIDRNLKTLIPRIQKKVVRQAMRKGFKLVLRDAIQRVPVLTGLLKSHIKMRATKRRRDRMGLVIWITPDPAFIKFSRKRRDQRAFYPSSVEYGHGSVPPHPFMRPAYDLTGPEARDVTMQELLAGTLREASQ
jgi:HK97 gp10 family phage protein